LGLTIFFMAVTILRTHLVRHIRDSSDQLLEACSLLRVLAPARGWRATTATGTCAGVALLGSAWRGHEHDGAVPSCRVRALVGDSRLAPGVRSVFRRCKRGVEGAEPAPRLDRP